jgi:hypothetical protein
MNEEEWFAVSDEAGVERMLAFLRTHAASPRKMRLLAAACCRHQLELLTRPECLDAIRTVELFADGRSTKAALKRARQAMRRLRATAPATEVATWRAYWAVECAATENAFSMTPGELLHSARFAAEESHRVAEYIGDLIFEIFNNPFRASPTIAPAILAFDGGIVTKLARSAYDERGIADAMLDPACLAVLADALEEAGCDNAELLEHLRGGHHHVRGCWAVDVVLGLK